METSESSSIEELSRRLLLPILVGIFSGKGGGALPASKKSIEAMKSVAVEGVVGEECPVCLDEFRAEAEAEAKEMPCRHRFHGSCIEKWLGMHGSCPVCRYRMPEEDDGELRMEVSITVLYRGPRRSTETTERRPEATERMDGLD